MTHTTTDASEARALPVIQAARDALTHAAKELQELWGSDEGDDVIILDALAKIDAFATAEAASGAGGREADLNAAADAYASDYVMSTEGADYEPTEWERRLVVDALHGFLADHAASLPPATDPAIPDGWKLVPVKPTDEMMKAANAAWINAAFCVHFASERAFWSAALAAAPTIPATGEAIASEEKPYPELLSTAEHQVLLRVAEEMWRALQTNNLGGYAGRNRPFYMLHEFRRVIETFGHRDTGLKWSKNDLDAHSKATISATGHAATEGEGQNVDHDQ